MATNSVTLIDGTIAYASDVEAKVNPLYVDIDNSNIAAGAGIVFSKLDAATVASVATSQTITGSKTFSSIITGTAGLAVTGDTTLGTNLFVVDDTNNRIYEGTTTTTTIDSIDYQHQINVLSAATPAFALISTATGSTGVREARYHNSASPAASDQIYHQKIYANNSSSVVKEFARVTAQIHTVTAGAEDGLWYVSVMKAGTLTNTLLAYHDMVQVRPESLVVGTNTNVTPYGTGEILGLYVKNTSADRRVAMFESTDDTASGILFDLYKNSVSPAASDTLGSIRFTGNDSAGNPNAYTAIISRITDTTNGSEDSQMDFQVQASGTLTNFISAVSTAGSVEVTVTGQLTIVGNTNSITSTNSTGDAFTITADSLTTGSALVVYSNSSSTSARNLVEITNDNASADAAVCFSIQQDGDAYGIYVDQNGATTAIYVNHDGTSGSCLYANRNANSGSNVACITCDGSNAGAGGLIALSGASLSGTTDFLFSFPSQGAASGAAGNKRIKVIVDGVAEYIYTHTS